MNEPKRTIAQMRELLRMAEALGFTDDVAHWRFEIARAEIEQAAQR